MEIKQQTLSFTSRNLGSIKKTAPELPPLISLVTLGTELLIEILKLEQRIKTTLAGIEDKSFLMVKLSPNDLMGTFRSEHVTQSPVIVKFQNKDTVYSFETEIVNVVSTPCKLMFLDFPKRIKEYKVRPELRSECALPAMIMLNNEIVDMLIVDISGNGCQCVIKISGSRREVLQKVMQVNTVLEVLTQFPETKERLKIVGRIRNIGADAENIRIGMSFETMADDLRSKVENYITKLKNPA